ncbi:hypothetical protein SEUCBS139899_001954 [Sporothrix eucalyptigena]
MTPVNDASLFSISIPSLGAHRGGSIVCTEPATAVYLLTFTSPPDNRLTAAFCAAMLDALDTIEFGGFGPGVVVTTSGISKFYSNGLDLDHALSTPGFWSTSLFALFRRLLTYPMPTVALVNGHAFAGGLMLAMYHDYRVMNPSKGFACLNELDFGAILKPPMSSIFRQKLPNSQVYRTLVLEAHRFPGPEALVAGLVDKLGGFDEALSLISERSLVDKGKTGVYGLLKAEMYRETMAYLSPEGHMDGETRESRLLKEDDDRKEAGEKRVAVLQSKSRL